MPLASFVSVFAPLTERPDPNPSPREEGKHTSLALPLSAALGRKGLLANPSSGAWRDRRLGQ